MNQLPLQIIDYLGRGAIVTGTQLLLVLGPAMGLALVLHHLSGFVRARVAAVVGLDIYTYLTAPGVAVHELGHAFFCIVFGHRIISMRLFDPNGAGRLGYVRHAYDLRSPYQRVGNFFIGTGPIWLGSALIFLLSHCLLRPGPTQPAAAAPWFGAAGVVNDVFRSAWELLRGLLGPSVAGGWRFWLFAYFSFCIASHITLSPSDVRGAAGGFAWLVGVLLVFNWLTLWLGGAGSSGRTTESIVRLGVPAYGALLFAAFLNAAIALLALLLSTAARSIR